MLTIFRKLAVRLFRLGGYEVTIKPTSALFPADFDAENTATIKRVWTPDRAKRLTMTSPERLLGLCRSIEYVVAHNIEGAIVECGVWKGGSMMAAALTLKRLGIDDRELYLFDTFEGMTPPTRHDVDRHGEPAADRLNRSDQETSWVWARSGLDEVRENMEQTEYNNDRIHYSVGRVEETIPADAPEKIAILRLDTDWYESTKHELEHLYPRLVSGGILIIDDYGHWEGARKAVDEYFEKINPPVFLNRVDETGRIIVKPTSAQS